MTKTDAINYFGNGSRLAEALSVSRAAVSRWPEQIPELRQLQLEKITKGALKAEAPEQTKAA